ncbi:FliI/YscN family ATPase [Neisseriaceae bacterium TC5R-5]|nr:FliI/YscN family ATPase [Neisseriaceae bacterium TC5R-5]
MLSESALLTRCLQQIASAPLFQSSGRITRLIGLLLEASGPSGARVGDVCAIVPPDGGSEVLAQVVGLSENRLLLQPYAAVQGLTLGCAVWRRGPSLSISAGPELLGRVVDALGRPLDDGPAIVTQQQRPLRQAALRPLQRQRIRQVLNTGVRAIDSLLTLGYGQRMAILAGSGVGKSTLLGMLVRQADADVVIVGLIGERGREVLEFIEDNLGADGLARAVVVVATADEPALMREAAVLSAMAMAEHFRDQGQRVLLIMDSLTRYAMARREVGLALGEPATARGYTPSVFSELANLLERCGGVKDGGSITGLFTVLVEGDDIHDPIADSVRGIVDGHIVLTRELANRGYFPAIDVLASVSRLLGDLSEPAELELARRSRQLLATLASGKDLVELGVYQPGSNPALDVALAKQPMLDTFLQQAVGDHTARAQALRLLARIVTE